MAILMVHRQILKNFHTSEQIRKFAQGILKGIEVDDLDGGGRLMAAPYTPNGLL